MHIVTNFKRKINHQFFTLTRKLTAKQDLKVYFTKLKAFDLSKQYHLIS